jgi:hypothetical protein
MVLCPQKLKPEQVLVVSIEHAPNPLGHQGQVHDLRVNHPQATLILGLADVLPADKMVLLLGTLTFPKESITVGIKTSMGA